jgi:glycosyltransferase involved in cell wall biosynthesis
MIKVSIVYPTDPRGNKVGGIETFLRGFIKFAPADFLINFIGITSHPMPLKKWVTVDVKGKAINFFPVLFEKNENVKSTIPLSLRFVLQLSGAGVKLEEQVLIFNRIEPVFLFRKSKSPKIGFIHTDIEKQILKKESEVFWRYFPGVYSWFENKVFACLDHIFVVNEKTISLYKNKYSSIAFKFNFIPTWADTEIFSVADNSKIDLRVQKFGNDSKMKLNEPFFLYVGRFQEQKAPLRVLESFFEYYKKNGIGNLILVGDGNLKVKMNEFIAQSGIGTRVYFFNEQPQAELASFYRLADLLLLTSNSEGMPRCVVEALRCGLPVVTTDVGEVRRMVKNGYSGEVVSSFCPSDIAASMTTVIANIQRYSKDNCVSSVAEYTPEQVLMAVYDKIRELSNKR